MAHKNYDGSSDSLYQERPTPYHPVARDEFGQPLLAFDENLFDGRPRPGTEYAYLRDENGGWIRREALPALAGAANQMFEGENPPAEEG